MSFVSRWPRRQRLTPVEYTHRVVVGLCTEAGLDKGLGLAYKPVSGRKLDVLSGVRGGLLKLPHGINDGSGADRYSGPAVGFDL